jgi:O-antigen ligase
LPSDIQTRFLERAALSCALAAGSACMVSIAASQILLGATLLALLLLRRRWQLPQGWPWIAVYFAWTLAALALSDAPRAGLPQVKKIFVWLFLIAILSTVRRLAEARVLVLAWLAGGTASAVWGLWQFAGKWQYAQAPGEDFYRNYVADRITGFNSHWMTFSGQMMVVLLSGLALLLWGRPGRRARVALIVCLPVVALALLLAMTRGIWIATAVGLVYLLWCWRRWTVALVPALALVALAVPPVRERALSLIQPHGQRDSNDHRRYTFRTGIEIVRAHPWFGLGPERVGPHFREYVPKDLSPVLPEGFYGHLHNIYLQFAAERGVPALLALLAFLALAMRRWLARLRAGDDGAAWLSRAAVAILIGILVTGLFEHNLGDSEMLSLTLVVVAVADAARGVA